MMGDATPHVRNLAQKLNLEIVSKVTNIPVGGLSAVIPRRGLLKRIAREMDKKNKFGSRKNMRRSK